MASGLLHHGDWNSSSPTIIYTRKAREPRDERVQLPKSTLRARPEAISVAPGEPSPLLRTSPIPQDERGDYFDSPCEPEIVDFAAPNAWSRRATPQKQPPSKRLPSRSRATQSTSRRSEINLGVLTYYFRDPSPPPTPTVDTPIIDPAIEEFDFELVPKQFTPNQFTPRGTSTNDLLLSVPQATPGADNENVVSSHMLTPPPSRPQPEQKGSYRLFPIIKESTPPSNSAEPIDLQSPAYSTPTSRVNTIRATSQPDPSYRPRKESVSSSVRSRKDSANSFSGTRRIKMRILTGGSTSTPKTISTASTSTSTASPPEQSRWSDDTITSPVVATTPGPRASFGSLLGRDSTQYPDCFFEDDDDDEGAPLRRKFPWKRSASLRQEQQNRVAGRLLDDRDSFGVRLRSFFLCGGCCGRS